MQLFTLIATIRDEKTAKGLMPWNLKRKTTEHATDEEIAAVLEEFETEIVFAAS